MRFFQVIGQLLQDQRQPATGFTRAHYAHIDGREFTAVLRQGCGQSGAAMHVRAQRGHQVTLAVVVGFIAQGAQGPLDRQAGAHQARQLACPHRQRQRVEGAGYPELAVPAGATRARTRIACPSG